MAFLATLTAITSVIGFFLHEIGPIRAVLSLTGQAVALILIFAGFYRGYGIANVEPLVDRSVALYFSVVTWTTLGYGDYQPAKALQLLAALEAGLGYVFLGLIVGLVANRLSSSLDGSTRPKPDHPGQWQ